MVTGNMSDKLEFQSTPPARGATVGIPNANTDKKISIHAPREGGDHRGHPRQ